MNTKRIVGIIALIILLSLVWVYRSALVEVISMIGDRDAIAAYLGEYGALGPVVLAIILGLQVFLAVIPGHAFIVAGGYIYGLLWGVVITQISTVVASQLAYLLARKAGRPFVERMAPADVINKWNKMAEKQGGLFFFFALILPIFPNDLMCFIAGLSSVSPKKFFVANFWGRLPCSIFITLIGSHGFEMPIQFWLVMGLALLGMSILWKPISSGLERKFIPASQPVA